MAITHIRKHKLKTISQKYDKKVNKRRRYIHWKLNQYFKERGIHFKIHALEGRLEVPTSTSDAIEKKELPNTIAKYFNELSKLDYSIQIVIT